MQQDRQQDRQEDRDREAPTSGEGRDSRVEDWFGQSVARDTELAEELSDELGEEEAEQRFDELSEGREEQDARHGDRIDPDQGTSAYRGGPGG